MATDERRHNDGRRSEDGHCAMHDDHEKAITSMKTERKVIAGVALFICALIGYVYNSNSSSISSDLKEIKAFMVSARDNDAMVRGELENIKWRLQALEGKR